MDVKRVATMSASASWMSMESRKSGRRLLVELGCEGLHRPHPVEVAGIFGVVMLVVDVVWGEERIRGIRISGSQDLDSFPGQAFVLFQSHALPSSLSLSNKNDAIRMSR